MKCLITGSSGVGKTKIITELERGGYTAINTDDYPGLTRLEDKITGKPVEWPEGYVDWSKYAWNWNVAKIKELLASDEHVFLGGIATNQYDLFPLFDYIILPTVSLKTLRHRLTTRTQHAFNRDNIEEMMKNYPGRVKSLTELGGIQVNNEGPIAQVVKEILDICHVNK